MKKNQKVTRKATTRKVKRVAHPTAKRAVKKDVIIKQVWKKGDIARERVVGIQKPEHTYVIKTLLRDRTPSLLPRNPLEYYQKQIDEIREHREEIQQQIDLGNTDGLQHYKDKFGKPFVVRKVDICNMLIEEYENTLAALRQSIQKDIDTYRVKLKRK